MRRRYYSSKNRKMNAWVVFLAVVIVFIVILFNKTTTNDSSTKNFTVSSPKSTSVNVSASPSANSTTSSNASSSIPTVKIGDSQNVDYSRSDFGTAWADVNNNNCDTRDDILARDLKNIQKEDSCRVESGVLDDPYTGTQITYTRGRSLVDIDHVVPLGYAYEHGAASWTSAQREAYANDPSILLAVSSKENRQKSDKGPSEWMPSNTNYQCEYGKKFLTIAHNYNLTVTQADYNAVVNVCK